MNESIPLTEQDRDLLVSGALTIIQLAEQFECTKGAIKRVQRQIREGLPVVYIFSPRRVRKKVKYRYCSTIVAPPKEAEESPFGLDHVAACEWHLVDLRKWHEPLSQQQTRVFAPLRAHRI